MKYKPTIFPNLIFLLCTTLSATPVLAESKLSKNNGSKSMDWNNPLIESTSNLSCTDLQKVRIKINSLTVGNKMAHSIAHGEKDRIDVDADADYLLGIEGLKKEVDECLTNNCKINHLMVLVKKLETIDNVKSLLINCLGKN